MTRDDREAGRTRYVAAVSNQPRGYLAALARQIGLAPQLLSMWKRPGGAWPEMNNEARLWRALRLGPNGKRQRRRGAEHTGIDKAAALATLQDIQKTLKRIEEALFDDEPTESGSMYSGVPGPSSRQTTGHTVPTTVERATHAYQRR